MSFWTRDAAVARIRRCTEPAAQYLMLLRAVTTPDVLPVLVARRGSIAIAAMEALYANRRVELFSTDEMTAQWISFARRMAGTILATEDDPWAALSFALTAGMSSPIVMAISRDYRSHSEDLIAAGSLACVIMPFSEADVERLVSLLKEHWGMAHFDARVGLLLDPIGRSVRYGDHAMCLSQREFALLYCLSSNQGRAVSAEALLTQVWGRKNTGDRPRHLLEFYISQLRRKLARIGLRDAVTTVRSFGYSLGQQTVNQIPSRRSTSSDYR